MKLTRRNFIKVSSICLLASSLPDIRLDSHFIPVRAVIGYDMDYKCSFWSYDVYSASKGKHIDVSFRISNGNNNVSEEEKMQAMQLLLNFLDAKGIKISDLSHWKPSDVPPDRLGHIFYYPVAKLTRGIS